MIISNLELRKIRNQWICGEIRTWGLMFKHSKSEKVSTERGIFAHGLLLSLSEVHINCFYFNGLNYTWYMMCLCNIHSKYKAKIINERIMVNVATNQMQKWMNSFYGGNGFDRMIGACVCIFRSMRPQLFVTHFVFLSYISNNHIFHTVYLMCTKPCSRLIA